jgi:hypothetical protein
MALAAVPKKDDKNIINVTCTPIAICDADTKKTEILDGLAFKATYHTDNPREIMDCFTRTTETIGQVVRLQEQSLEHYKGQYRPKVAIDVGGDNRNPFSRQMLHVLLFGSKLTPESIAARNIAKDGLADVQVDKPNTPRDKLKSSLKVISEDRKTRKTFLQGNPAYGKKLAASFENLADYLDKSCLLRWGGFSRTCEYDDKVLPYDPVLAPLKKGFESSDPAIRDFALKELIKQAQIAAMKAAVSVNSRPSQFGLAAPIHYKNDCDAQDRFPFFMMFDLHPAIRAAFYEQFQITLRPELTRTYKLPMDPDEPPFVTTCGDNIRAQLRQMNDNTIAYFIHDAPQWREKLAKTSRKTARQIRSWTQQQQAEL